MKKSRTGGGGESYVQRFANWFTSQFGKNSDPEHAYRSEFAGHVFAVLQAQAKDKIPDVVALRAVFTAFDEDNRRPGGNQRFAQDVVLACDRISTVMTDHVPFQLFPCTVYLIKKLLEYQALFRAQHTESADVVRRWCMETTHQLGSLPSSYDGLLFDERGGPSENLRCLMESFVARGGAVAYDLLHYAVVAYAGLSTIAEREDWQKRLLTFIRLDFKICWLYRLNPDDVWPRYMPKLVWTKGATVAKFLDMWEDLLQHCLEFCGGDLPFTTRAFVALLERLYFSVSGHEKDLTMAVAVQLIARFGRFGPQGKFDGELLAEWLYHRIAQASRSTRDEQRELFSQLMVYVIGACSKQTVRQVMLAILAKHTTFSSKIEQLEMIVTDVRSAGEQVHNVGTTLVSDLQGYFIDAMIAGKQSVPAKDLAKSLASQNSDIRDLSAQVVAGIFAGHRGLRLAGSTTGYFGKDLGNLVDDMVAAGHSDLISRSLVQIVQLYAKWAESRRNNPTLYDLLDCCCYLRTVEVSAEQLEELSSLPYNWRTPIASQRGYVSTSSPLLTFFGDTMKKIKQNKCLVSERSLALLWWRQLLIASKRTWGTALSGSYGRAKDRLLDLFSQFPYQIGVDHPVLEWLIYAALFPITSDQPWNVPGMHLLLQRCNNLRQQLGVDSPWLESHFQWYDRLLGDISAIHAKLRDRDYTEEEHAYYQRSVEKFVDAFQAVGLEPLQSTRLPPPSSLLQDLRDVCKLLGWLQARGVRGFQQLCQSAQQVLATAQPTYRQLSRCISQVYADREILGLQEKLMRGSTAQSCPGHNAAVRDFIQHFVLHESIIFNTMVQGIARGQHTATMRDVTQCVRTVHEVFTQLLSCQLTIQRLRHVLEALKFADVGKEVQTIRSFPLYASEQFQQDEELVRTLNNSFQTMQYITCAASVAQALTQFEVVPANDPDLIKLQGLEMADHLTLRDIPNVFSDVRQIFAGLSPQHLSIFEVVRSCGNLVSFFRETKFHLPDGQRRWQELRENITMRLRGDSFKSALLNAVIASYHCLTPFILTGISLRRAVQEAGSQREVSAEMASMLQTASQNIAQVRLLFEQAESSTTDNALQLARQLLEHGQVRFYLRQLSCRPSTFDFQYDLENVGGGAANRLIVLHEDDVIELRRQLVFCSRDSENSELALSFLEIMSAVNELRDVLFALEKDGHPEHQHTSEHCVPLSNVQQIKTTTTALRMAAGQWKQQVSDQRQTQELLQLFTNNEIAHMLSLLISSPRRRVVIEKMTSDVTTSWPSYPHGPSKEKEWAARCLSSFIMSAATMATPRTNNPIPVITSSLNCLSENATSLGALQTLSELLSKLLNKDATQDPLAAGGRQYVCSFPRAQVSETMTCNRLAQIFIKNATLPSAAQIFHCKPESTTSDIELFMQRVQTFQSCTFTMLGVDHLSIDSRKVLARLQQQLHNCGEHGNIYYVFLETMAARTHSWLEILDEDECDWDEQAEAIKGCLRAAGASFPRPRVTSVVGAAGDGKTHYAQSMAEDCTVISINDQPNISLIIQRLNSLPLTARLFINISAHAPLTHVNWIFFQLFLCGCLKDPEYGATFTLPQHSNWQWWVEIPYRAGWNIELNKKPTRSLVPTLALFATEQLIVPMVHPLHVGLQERFVARYVSEYFARRIDRKCSETSPVSFNEVPSDEAARMAVTRLVREKARFLESRRIDQVMFLRYLHRRFQIFVHGVFTWDTEHPKLGSTLFEQFVREATFLCQRELNCTWRDCTETFLITDSSGGSFYPLYPASISFERVNPDVQKITHGGEKELVDVEKGTFKHLAVRPDKRGTRRREVPVEEGTKEPGSRWLAYLAWTFGLPYDRVEKLLKSKEFVLTPDFTYKMILIQERKLARIPVIIEGETGVGKTYLLEMYAILLNEQAQQSRDQDRAPRILERICHWLRTVVFVSELLGPILNQDANNQRRKTEQDQLQEENYTPDTLLVLWQWLLGLAGPLPENEDQAALHPTSLLRQFVSNCYANFPLLQYPPPRAIGRFLVNEEKPDRSRVGEDSCQLLTAFLRAPINKMLHRILIHPGISNRDVEEFLSPIITLATHQPYLEFVIFFDEVNTSSCLGVFKEILMDHMLNGKHLPDNMFFVAAINPHIKEEGALVGQQLVGREATVMEVTRRVYFVHKLPDVMASIKWQYNTLHRDELRNYILNKIKLQQNRIVKETGDSFTFHLTKKFTDIVLAAQVFCMENLHQSSVSQRDIQRVFKLVPFFRRILPTEVDGTERGPNQILVECIYLAIAVVYYLRLPQVPSTNGGVCRLWFEESLRQEGFSDVVRECVNNFVTRENFHIPPGVALNDALKENIFAIIACIHTSVPIGIIGAPGSSKTLSFHIVRDNLRGKQSRKPFCQNLDAVDSFFYQCSEHSTSNEIKSVFDKAIERQKFYADTETCAGDARGQLTRCVVFLDEAGLPKEDSSDMVLKVLHPFLDECKVSFVAISNRHFDSANENRMVIVLRSLATLDDLCVLALGCLGIEETEVDQTTLCFVRGICRGFLNILKDEVFARLFHYRDLVYTLRFLHRNRLSGHSHGLQANSALFLRALEENFNGMSVEHFRALVEIFFATVNTEMSSISLEFPMPNQDKFRGIIDIMQDSMRGREDNLLTDVDGSIIGTGHPLAPRFKMIIDPTDDHSAIRLLQQVGLLDAERSQIFCMSELPEDTSDLHAAETISSIRFALEKPVTAVLVNTSRIHGSLYDLLNQSYRVMPRTNSNDNSGDTQQGSQQVFANIAMGSVTYPCPVDPRFQCLVFLRLSHRDQTPAPFLSRFEKYLLSVDDFLQLRLQELEEEEHHLVLLAYKCCQAFVEHLGESSFYGYQPSTLPSLFLAHIKTSAPGLPPSFDRYARLTQTLRDRPYMQDCDPLQRIVRSLCAELLQLVPPETFLLKLRTFEQPDVYADIYFNVLEHFSLRQLVGVFTGQQLADDTAVHQQVSNKLLIFTRTSPILQCLVDLAEKHFGRDVASQLLVEDASRFLRKREIDEFVQAFETNPRKTCCLITANTAQVQDLQILHQTISDSRAEKNYVLVVHFPPGQAHGQSAFAASFLNGWSCMFLDTSESTVFHLRQFAEMFISGVTGSPEEDGDAQTVLSDGLVGRCHSLALEYCSCINVSPLFPESQMSTNRRQALRFYQQGMPVAMRSEILEGLLEQHQVLFSYLERYFFEIFSDRHAFNLVYQLAVDISSRKIACGMADEVDRRIHQKLLGVFAYIVTTLIQDGGLLPLVECSGEILHHLLKLIPPPTDDQLGKHWWSLPSPRQCLPKTPLLPYVAQHMQTLVQRFDLMLREGAQQLHEALVNDAIFGRILESPGADAFQQGYCFDHIVKTMVSGKLSRDKLAAVGVLEHWVRLECDTDLMSHCHCLLVQERTSADTLFGTASAVAQLGSQWTGDDLQQYGDFSRKFCNNFVMKAAEKLWEYLLSLSTEEYDWSGSAGRFIKAFQAVEPVVSSTLKQQTVIFADNVARQVVLMTMAHSCLGCLDAVTARRLLSALPAMTRPSDVNISVLQCFVQHCVSMIGSEEVLNKTSLVVALAEVVLLWIAAVPHPAQQSSAAAPNIKKADLACILQLLNCRGLPPDLEFPEEAGRQILAIVSVKFSHKKEVLSLAINDELRHGCSGEVGCYIPVDYPDPASSPAMRQQLAHLHFWNSIRVEQLHSSSLVLLQSKVADRQQSYSRFTDSIEAEALMRTLLDKLADFIVRWDVQIAGDIMANRDFGDILLSLVNNQFQQNNHHELYLLKAVMQKCGKAHLVQCLQSSTHAWARRIAGALAQSESRIPESRFTFMIAPQPTENVPHAFTDAHSLYFEFSQVFESSKSSQFAGLRDWCNTKLEGGTAVDQMDIASCLKVFLLVKIYHDYFSKNRLQEVQQLQPMLDQLGRLQMVPWQNRIFRLLLVDGERTRLPARMIQIFNPTNTDSFEIMARDVMVNQAASLMALGQRSNHWTSLLIEPNSLYNTFYFGAIYYRGTLSGIKIDCCSQYDSFGQNCLSIEKCLLPLRATYVNTILTFSATLWHVMFEGESKTLRVLSKGYIDRDGFGADMAQKTASFCFMRVATAIHFFQSIGKPSQISPETCNLLLTRSLERLLQLQLGGRTDFQPKFTDEARRNSAEEVFRRQVFQFVLDNQEKYERQMLTIRQQSELEKNLRQFPNRPRITFQAFNDAYGMLPQVALKDLSLLHRFLSNSHPLHRLSLVSPLVKFFIWFHQNCSHQLVETDSTKPIFEVMRGRSSDDRMCFDQFREAFNKYHEQTGGQLRPGACDDSTQFFPVNDDTQVQYVVDVLPIAIEQLLLPQQDFLVACQSYTIQEDDALRVMLEASSIQEQIPLPQLSTGDHSHLMCFDVETLEMLACRCGSIDMSGGKAVLNFNWNHAQHLVLLRFVSSACPIDLNILHQRFVYALKPSPKAMCTLQNNEQLNTALPEEFRQLLRESMRAELTIQIGQQHYQQVLQLLHTLAMASNLLALTESAPEIDQHVHTSLTNFLLRLQPESTTGVQHQVNTMINSLHLPGLMLTHLADVHQLASEYLENRGYLHTHLPPLLRYSLPDEEHQRLDQNLKRLLSLERATDVSRIAETVLQALHSCVGIATDHPDSCLADLLRVFDVDQSILDLIPSSVHGQHLACVVSIVVDLAEKAWLKAEQEAMHTRRPWREPSLQRMEPHHQQQRAAEEHTAQPNRYDQWLDQDVGPAGELQSQISVEDDEGGLFGASAFGVDEHSEDLYGGPVHGYDESMYQGFGDLDDTTEEGLIPELVNAEQSKEEVERTEESLPTTQPADDLATADIEDESNNPPLLDPDTVKDAGDEHPRPATDDLGEMLLGEEDPVTEAVTLSLEECFSGPALIPQTNSSPLMDWSDSDVNWELSQELDTVSLLEAVAIGSVHMSMTSQPDVVEPAPTLRPVEVVRFVLHREGRVKRLLARLPDELRNKARDFGQLDCPAILVDDFGRVLEGSNMPSQTQRLFHVHVHTQKEVMTVAIERGQKLEIDGQGSAEIAVVEMKFASETTFLNIVKAVLCQGGHSSTQAGLHCGDGVLLDPDKPLSSIVQENPGLLRLFLVLGDEVQSAIFSQSSGGMPSPPERPILLSHLSQLLPPASEVPLVLRPNPVHLPHEDTVIFAVPRQCLYKVIFEANKEKSSPLAVLGNTLLGSVHATAAKYSGGDAESTVLLCNGSPVPSTLSVQSLSSNTETITLSLSPIPEPRSLQIELPSKETAPFELTSSTTVKDIVDHLMKEQSLDDSNFCLVDCLTMCSLPPSHVVNTSWLLRPSPQLTLLSSASMCPLTLKRQETTRRHGEFEILEQIRVAPTCSVHKLLSHLQWIEGWSSLFQNSRPPVVIDASVHVLLPNGLLLGRMQLRDNLPLLLSVRSSTSINPVTLSVVHGEGAPLTVQTDSPVVPIGNVITFLAPLLDLIVPDCLLVGQHGKTTYEFICDDQCPVSLVAADLRGDEATNHGRPLTFIFREDSSYLAQKKVTINLALLSDPENEITTLSLLLSSELPFLLEQAREALNVSSLADDLDLLAQWNGDQISLKVKKFNLRQAVGHFGQPLQLLLQVPYIDVEVMPIGRQEGSVKLQLPSSLSLMDMAHTAMDSLGVDAQLENFNLEINEFEVDLTENGQLSLHNCVATYEQEDTCLRLQFSPKMKPLLITIHMKDTPDVSKQLQLYPWTPLEKLAENALLALNVQADAKKVSLDSNA